MLQMYSIFDKKAAVFDRPFFVQHVQEAMRAVQAAFDTPKDRAPWFVRNPEEYALYLVGSFDQAAGGVMPPESIHPQFTIELSALAPKPQANQVNMFESKVDRKEPANG